MRKKEALKRINTLLDDFCETCEVKIILNTDRANNTGRLARHCTNKCIIGIELIQMGAKFETGGK